MAFEVLDSLARFSCDDDGCSHCLVAGAKKITTAGPLLWSLAEGSEFSARIGLKPIREFFSGRSTGGGSAANEPP